MKRKVWLIVIALLAISVLAACGPKAPDVDWELKITGAVSDPLTLSYADLAKRDQVTLTDVVMRKSQGEDTTNDWSGVELAPLLEEAGVSADATVIVATASDGYAREIPLADMGGAIIALQQDGEWIADDAESGPIRLVVPDLPANNWLFQVVELSAAE